MAALGRGLDSLMAQGGGGESGEAQREIAIAQIRPNPLQPRKVFDTSHLEDLRSSIENHGILQPICVRRVEGGYEIISGERRWRAARLAGLRNIPAVVREDVSNSQMMELALVENLQRQDLDPMEKARGFLEMIEALDLTQEQVAAKVGLKRSTVTNHLRLLDLEQEVQDALVSGLISMGHARALLGVAGGSKEKKQALAKIVRDDLTVRQTEELVRDRVRSEEKDIPRAPGGGGAKLASPKAESWVVEIERRIREALGLRVHLNLKNGYKGQVVLDVSGRDDLEVLVERLAPKKTL